MSLRFRLYIRLLEWIIHMSFQYLLYLEAAQFDAVCCFSFFFLPNRKLFHFFSLFLWLAQECSIFAINGNDSHLYTLI